eukprot:TRINITY_DN39039_c0_g1_i1.p1 TRINITY_DN39039_c0_g1~~TRINITY_DN39039_c0_g1_i1.p1  ORF type:complete len:111 (+),score=2.32 TRINITY_DN39039_c0_g1_i1:191-523(+)
MHPHCSFAVGQMKIFHYYLNVSAFNAFVIYKNAHPASNESFKDFKSVLGKAAIWGCGQGGCLHAYSFLSRPKKRESRKKRHQATILLPPPSVLNVFFSCSPLFPMFPFFY